jgi:hypothetical protein
MLLFKIIIIFQFPERIIELIGIKTNLMTYPTTPMTANPIAHDWAILINSNNQKKKNLNKFLDYFEYKIFLFIFILNFILPFLSGLVHLFTNLIEF